MKHRYDRNRLYVNQNEQEIVKNFPVLLGGAGIGSIIAECALRFGFENITIIDGDQVESSNLNRQNYREKDVSIHKVKALKERLESINSNANIKIHNCFLTEENVQELIEGHKVAINALDFSSDVPLLFDEICQQKNIPVLHPYNLGWGSLVTVITPDSISLRSLAKKGEKFSELSVVEYVSSYMRFWGEPQEWLENIIHDYIHEKEKLSPPQLSVGSWNVAGMCVHLLFNIATKREVKSFPEFYFSSLFGS
ncbi:ThiF family adenylyltransferase [Tenacibaculum sp. FZY0031]|uniref:HesA/MoeB/ThiF family protein n=1 Tax=unclassified Tenacibaculum TaxID=2635139 RepID=UPI002EB7A57B|nr:ThiF family adenylyltransferase [Tenacibaculum sp. FZY0031]